MTGKEAGEVAFLAFLIALVFALALTLGGQSEPRDPGGLTPLTIAPPVTTTITGFEP